jgi:hypothetical protein
MFRVCQLCIVSRDPDTRHRDPDQACDANRADRPQPEDFSVGRQVKPEDEETGQVRYFQETARHRGAICQGQDCQGPKEKMRLPELRCFEKREQGERTAALRLDAPPRGGRCNGQADDPEDGKRSDGGDRSAAETDGGLGGSAQAAEFDPASPYWPKAAIGP